MAMIISIAARHIYKRLFHGVASADITSLDWEPVVILAVAENFFFHSKLTLATLAYSANDIVILVAGPS